MPSVPRPRCDQYQCKTQALPGSRFCSEHAPAKTAKTDRRELDHLYKSSAWSQIRQAQLSAYPICQACEEDGRITVADVVDHVFRWKDYGIEAFRLNLFSSLCSPCHSRKNHLEQLGVFRRYRDGSHQDFMACDWPSAVHESK